MLSNENCTVLYFSKDHNVLNYSALMNQTLGVSLFTLFSGN